MFKYLFYIGLPLIMVFSIMTATAKDSPAALLESHLWEERVLVLVAPNAKNEAFMTQQALLDEALAGLKERDMAIYHVVDREYVKRNGEVLPHVPSTTFISDMGLDADSYSVTLIGKDGEIKHTHHNVWPIKDIFAMIDAMPMRQREMRQ